MLWDCMLRRWLGSAASERVEEEAIDRREQCEERIENEGRYAEMRAYLGYPS